MEKDWFMLVLRWWESFKNFAPFDILIASSRVTGIILPVSRRRFVTTESEDIYSLPDMSAGENQMVDGEFPNVDHDVI